MPQDARVWSQEDLDAVLIHELSHVRRFDFLRGIAIHLVKATLWFNPLVWLASRRLVCETEVACDDQVMLQGAVPDCFAELLLRISQRPDLRRQPVLGIALARRHSTLHRRVRAILNPGQNRGVGNLPTRVFASVAALFIAGEATEEGLYDIGGNVSGWVKDSAIKKAPTMQKAYVAKVTLEIVKPTGQIVVCRRNEISCTIRIIENSSTIPVVDALVIEGVEIYHHDHGLGT